MTRDHTTPFDAMAANRDNWNARVPVHVAPDGYDLERLRADATAISEIVAFDIERLGDLSGKDLVHLQCHIGTDTVSLARLGATVTGLDFAEDAITEARDLAEACGVPVRFEVGNVYDAPSVLRQTYDIVYTGVGAINWLPDIARWAQVVAALLRPGGRLHLFEGHPVLWCVGDDTGPDDVRLNYPYFETASPVGFSETSSYAGSGEVVSPRHYEWNHGIGEIVQAVLDAGLVLTGLEEHRVIPWGAFDWFEPVPGTSDWTRLPAGMRDRFPLSYTLQATKPS
jgi:SAM-dependent methyltransferase